MKKERGQRNQKKYIYNKYIYEENEQMKNFATTNDVREKSAQVLRVTQSKFYFFHEGKTSAFSIKT